MKILVAEDNPANRDLILEVLELGGHEVTMAEDGGEALTAFVKVRPDLVLLDIQMPVLDGYQVLRHLRARTEDRHLPIIALTAYAMRGDRERALEAGFDSYVTKPIDFNRLLQEIELHGRSAKPSLTD